MMYLMNRCNAPDPQAAQKADVLTKRADSLKTVANTARANETAVDDKYTEYVKNKAKKAAKRSVAAKTVVVGKDTVEMARRIVTFKIEE